MAGDWKKLLLIMVVYASLITLIWWTWLRYQLPQWSAYVVYSLIALSCLYFVTFKAQKEAKSDTLTRKTNWRNVKILATALMLALFMYPTLDLVYIHIWFTSENAILVPLTWGPISVAYVAILEWIKRAEKRETE